MAQHLLCKGVKNREVMLWSFVIGLVAGWLANLIIRGDGYGLIANLIIGLVGSLLGGWLAQLLSFDDISLLGIIIASIVGAVVLLCAVAIITKRNKRMER